MVYVICTRRKISVSIPKLKLKLNFVNLSFLFSLGFVSLLNFVLIYMI